MMCPYCNEEMIEVNLFGDRYALKWLPKSKELFMGLWVKDGIKVGTSGVFSGRPRVEATMCQSCQKMIIDLNQINNQ